MTSSQNKAAMQVHLPQWQASQLSQASYCKQHNLKPHIFSYYKNKLSESRTIRCLQLGVRSCLLPISSKLELDLF